MRHETERRPAGALGNEAHAALEQGRIAAEAVDDEAADHRSVRLVEHGLGADEARDDAAPVDVAHEHHGHVGGAGETHIGDVAGSQVHFRRRARAFDEDEIGLVGQPRKTVENGFHETRLPGLVFPRLRRADDAALHHNLRADLALGLQQHRIHVDAGGNAGRARLQRLGAADLAAIRRDGGIVRHVLRLEGPDLQTLAREDPAQARHQKRLAHIGAGALDHQSAHQNSTPSCAFTPAAKWCLTRVISVTRSAASISSGFALRPVTTTWRPGLRWRRVSTTSARSRYS